jgi:hypothetical protein
VALGERRRPRRAASAMEETMGSGRCGLAPRGASAPEKVAAGGCHAHSEAPALEKPKVAATALEKASGGQAVGNAMTAVRAEKCHRLFLEKS